MLARKLIIDPTPTPRPLEEIKRLIQVYPEDWRQWCKGPENGGCACMGCVRQPAPSTVRGDPEYAPWHNEDNALSEQEVNIWLAADKKT